MLSISKEYTTQITFGWIRNRDLWKMLPRVRSVWPIRNRVPTTWPFGCSHFAVMKVSPPRLTEPLVRYLAYLRETVSK